MPYVDDNDPKKNWGKTYPSKAYDGTNVYAEESKLDLKSTAQDRALKRAVDRSYQDGKSDGYNEGFIDGVQREHEKAQDKIREVKRVAKEKKSKRQKKAKDVLIAILIALGFIGGFAVLAGLIYLFEAWLGEWGPVIPIGAIFFTIIAGGAYFIRKESRS